MLAILISIALASLDTAIANTALPAIATSLHTTPAASVWIINAYQLSAVATILAFASFGGVVGHRKIYLFGLVLFTVSSALCAMSTTLTQLTMARVLQGVGASAIMSVNAALIFSLFPPEKLGKGMGLNALVVGMSFAAGPTVASLILSVANWPWLFGVNIPIGLIALAMAIPSLPHTPPNGQRFAWITAGLSIVTFGSLIYALGEGAQFAGTLPICLALLVCLTAGFVMIRREAGHPAPMFPIDLLKRPMFALSALTAVCSFATQGLAFVSLPFFFETVLGRDPVQTGYLMTPWSVVVALIAPFAGRLSDRYPPGLLGGIGLGVLALGMLSLALLPSDPSALDIGIRMVICGLGFGFFQSPNQKALMTSAPRERSSGASGMIATARLIGQSTGAALVALSFGLSATHGPVIALYIGAGFATAACLASFSRLVARNEV
ncbi:MFS transporter [Pseudomonas gingeri NCPPB 3146 = LMG 5327]|uniref:MFS transporter n=2 Tax=Pseudomonas gingeri TaxID=117681 RepID=A0A7Y8CCH7_9PSED|nr:MULTISPECIES: MFS transporter [Pseudomonas]NWC12972.1 MFS transporter [Pseudomonas gingeri]NWE46507.1 MFS transporter [Pseudomonas gingeri]NWE69866.1 MFS transporter [Pseudomonas gingeri]PNQ90594.1 MFS transporter [Pseudomonas gingeri NCPPB 3146 = LMG 5327]BBP77605.1 MFS transporter [Pseudomonas sp. Ost2]